MKKTSLPAVAFLAVAATLILLPVGAAAAAIAISAAGLLLVAAADYGRKPMALRAAARVIPFDAPGRSPAGLREAA